VVITVYISPVITIVVQLPSRWTYTAGLPDNTADVPHYTK